MYGSEQAGSPCLLCNSVHRYYNVQTVISLHSVDTFFFLCFQLLLLNITQIPADQNRNNDLKLYYKPHTPSLPVKH